MQVKIEIVKKITTENGKIFRIGDVVSFRAYRASFSDETYTVSGAIKDLTENSIYIENATLNGKKTKSVHDVLYELIIGDSCKFGDTP